MTTHKIAPAPPALTLVVGTEELLADRAVSLVVAGARGMDPQTDVRDISAAQARVLRGSLALGLDAGEAAALPASGVSANVKLQRVDLDAWSRVMNKAGIQTSAAPAAGDAEASYLPSVMALRANEINVQGYQLRNLVAGASREGVTWRANMDADELSGYADYRAPGAGASRSPKPREPGMQCRPWTLWLMTLSSRAKNSAGWRWRRSTAMCRARRLADCANGGSTNST